MNEIPRDKFYYFTVAGSVLTVFLAGLMYITNSWYNPFIILIRSIIWIIAAASLGIIYLKKIKIFFNDDHNKEILKKITLCHLPFYLLWFHSVDYKVVFIGNISNVVWLIPVLFIGIVLKQFLGINIGKINKFFNIQDLQLKQSQFSFKLLLLGMFLFLFLFLIFVISTLLFILNFSVSAWSVIFSFTASTCFIWFLVNKNIHAKKFTNFAVILFFAAFIVIGSIYACGKFYNYGFDSQEYHSEMVIQMANGWNPFYETLKNKDYDYVEWKKENTVAINCFPKAIEIIAASIFKFTGNYEQSKALQIILILASFFIIFSIFLQFSKIPKFTSFTLSGVLAFNPVSISESLSFYVDGPVILILLLISISALLLFFKDDKLYLLLFGAAIIFGINIKLTSVIFIAIFLAGISILYLLLKRERLNFKFISSILISFMIGLAFLGFNPYITNTINHGSPFFPYLGEAKNMDKFFKKDISPVIVPDSELSQNKNNFEKKKTGIELKEEADSAEKIISEKEKIFNKDNEQLEKNIARQTKRNQTKQAFRLNTFSARLELLMINSFSRTGYPDYETKIKRKKSYVSRIPLQSKKYLKIPFRIYGSEVHYLGMPCPHYTGGFGPLFGGILVLSQVLFIISLFVSFRKSLIIFFPVVLITFSVLITSNGYFPRYGPQFWLAPFCVIPIIYYTDCRNIIKKILRIFIWLLLITALLNGGLFIKENFPVNYYATKLFKIKYQTLSKLESPITVCFYSPFRSAYKCRFDELGIKYIEVLNDKEYDLYIGRHEWHEGKQFWMYGNKYLEKVSEQMRFFYRNEKLYSPLRY